MGGGPPPSGPRSSSADASGSAAARIGLRGAPAIMTRLDNDDLRSRELDSAAVRILDVDLAAGQEPNVRVHAEIGADDRFHVFGPAKSRRVDDAFHATGASSNNINLGAADFAAFAAGDGREKWIVDIHETSTDR